VALAAEELGSAAVPRGRVLSGPARYPLSRMAQDNSFDVVSDFDQQELVNALDQARREIGTRFDFKGVTADIDQEKEQLVLLTDSDMHLKAILDVLQSKLHKRGIDLKVLDPQKPEPAAKGNVRQAIKLRRGITDDLARDLNKKIRAAHPKVQVRIEGDKLRVSSKSKDDLQGVIGFLRGMELDVPLQFTNYR
jgi:cyclic-di-GMP-binding protein